MPPVQVALVIAFLVISLSVHEAAHGWTAMKCGDPTARDLGRVTLNPLAHIDPLMTVIVPAILYVTTGFIFGGARPVPVDATRLRRPGFHMVLVALAGPVSNVILAVIFLVAYKAAITYGFYAGAAETYQGRRAEILPLVMYDCAWFNVLLAVFNMVPIPPLDGSRVMAWFLPSSLRQAYVGLERVGMLLIFGLIILYRPFQGFLLNSVTSVLDTIDFFTGGRW